MIYRVLCGALAAALLVLGVGLLALFVSNTLLPDDHRLPFHFLVDADHAVIDRFGVYNDEFHEAIEAGVPHPTTYVLDRDGAVLFKDSRKDYHIWLSSSVLRGALEAGRPASPGRTQGADHD